MSYAVNVFVRGLPRGALLALLSHLHIFITFPCMLSLSIKHGLLSPSTTNTSLLLHLPSFL